MKNYEVHNIKDSIYEHIKSLEPLEIAYHSDADGVSSAAILMLVFSSRRDKEFPYSPEHFGMYKDGNIAVDLGAPFFKDWGNRGEIVIDHHSHPESPTYPAVIGRIPTGLLLYEVLKEHIPSDKRWLCVLSAVGDGQPELIPDEIWDSYPELFHMSGNIYKSKFGTLKAYPYPLYAKLASPINSLCRIGAVAIALEIVLKAKSIRDIINNPVALKAQKDVATEEARVLSDPNHPITIETISNVSIVTYRSKYNLAGRIGANLVKDDKNNTFIIINEQTKDVSGRGVLALYIANKLRSRGYIAGGHPGFVGCTLLPEQSTDILIEDLRGILSGR